MSAHKLFNPTINLGHIVSTVLIVVTAAMAWKSMEKDVEAMDEKYKVAVDEQKEELLELKGEIADDLQDIKRAIERISDRQIKLLQGPTRSYQPPARLPDEEREP